MEEPLARIEEVDLSTIWPNEATDFTPWLADHISELGNALGLEDLELQGREVPVGGFSLDILASDQGVGNVVIENQLEAADHKHLGQLLTYAAGFADANVMVWIAKEFRDEHRAALDFLNNRTDESTKFFGVVVELWKIGDSRPAPHFRVVSAPNDWSKSAVSSNESLSERGERYRQFWQRLVDTMRENYKFTKGRKGSPNHWQYFSTGVALIRFSAAITKQESRIEVYIDKTKKELNKSYFDRLEEAKPSIESEVGEALRWERLDDRKASRISVVGEGSIDDEEESLDEIFKWMVEKLLAFKEVFGPRLAALKQELE